MGGTLTLSTCGLTSDNTVIYAGRGCPTSAADFACVAGNDNADDDGGDECTENPGASTLVLFPTTARTYFIEIGGY